MAPSRSREFAFSLNPRTLTFVQSWRLGGFTFLVLYSAGLIPTFAVPLLLMHAAHRTQVWLAVSDEPAATVTGKYLFHKQLRKPNPRRPRY